MATAYSQDVQIGSYNIIRLRVEYSGTSAHCYIEFTRNSAWTDTWNDPNASITFNGTTVSAPYYYSGTVTPGTYIQLCDAGGFAVSASGGTYNWSFDNPTSGAVLGCSGTITIPAQSLTEIYVPVEVSGSIVRKEVSKAYVPVSNSTLSEATFGEITRPAGADESFETMSGAVDATSFVSACNANANIKNYVINVDKTVVSIEAYNYSRTFGALYFRFSDGSLWTISLAASVAGFGFPTGTNDKTCAKCDATLVITKSKIRKTVTKVYAPVYDSTSQTYKRKLSFEAV